MKVFKEWNVNYDGRGTVELPSLLGYMDYFRDDAIPVWYNFSSQKGESIERLFQRLKEKKSKIEYQKKRC